MILVTGGTGLVGAHLLYKLVSSEQNVRAIYRSKKKLDHVKNVFSCYTNDFESLFNKIDWVKADILDIPALNQAFIGISHVYHCAAFVSFEPDKYLKLKKTNIEGTANIVNLCLSFNIEKLCYVSSIATLGTELKNKPITENTFYNNEADNSVYAITKYGAEMEVWRATQEGLNAVIVNPGVILGAGIWHKGTGALFKKAKKGFKYYPQGSVALVAVEDVVDIMIKLLNSSIKNERFILVSENYTYKTFLEQLANSVDGKIPKTEIKPWLLQLAWRADWLKHMVFRKRRKLTKHITRSLMSNTVYSNEKVKSELNYTFKPMAETITAIGATYLKAD